MRSPCAGRHQTNCLRARDTIATRNPCQPLDDVFETLRPTVALHLRIETKRLKFGPPMGIADGMRGIVGGHLQICPNEWPELSWHKEDPSAVRRWPTCRINPKWNQTPAVGHREDDRKGKSRPECLGFFISSGRVIRTRCDAKRPSCSPCFSIA